MEKAMLRTWPLDSAMGRVGREGSWVAVRGENRLSAGGLGVWC